MLYIIVLIRKLRDLRVYFLRLTTDILHLLPLFRLCLSLDIVLIVLMAVRQCAETVYGHPTPGIIDKIGLKPTDSRLSIVAFNSN